MSSTWKGATRTNLHLLGRPDIEINRFHCESHSQILGQSLLQVSIWRTESGPIERVTVATHLVCWSTVGGDVPLLMWVPMLLWIPEQRI